MKKYVKPELILEHYELSNTIADCAWEIQSVEPNTCTAYGDEKHGLGKYHLFMEGFTGCTYTPEVIQFYCYQNGSDGMNLFKS